jgi:hypothetical protein
MQKIIHFANLTKLKKTKNFFHLINCNGSIFKSEIIYKQKNIYLTVDWSLFIKHCYKYNKNKEERKKKTVNLKKFLLKFKLNL